MRRSVRPPLVLVLCLVWAGVGPGIGWAAGAGGGWAPGGWLELQGRRFPDPPLGPHQAREDLSFAAEPAWGLELGGARFDLVPFVRWDSADRERTHADIRELSVRGRLGDWTWLAGVGRVFWGTAESRHLVDIVNQADQVEDIDEESRLGQPMIAVSRSGPWGTLDLYALPGARERTYPGPHGRLYLPIDTDNPVFQSPDKGRDLGWAARWSKTLGAWDLGIGGFLGTRRDPRLEPDPQLGLAIPYYDRISQLSLDLQGAVGNWVFKLESFYRDTPVDDYAALVGGFERTSYGVLGTPADLGLLVEYLYDGRENTLETPYENDLFLGLRLGLNDPQGTQVLGGGFVDLEHDSLFWRLEASRRLGAGWTLALKATAFPRTVPWEPIHFWRRDGYGELTLRRHF